MVRGSDGRRPLGRRDAGPPGAALLTFTSALVYVASFAVTTALAIYGLDVAGALGAGLAGARVVPAAAAGVFGGRVAGRGRPGSVLLGALLGQLLAVAAMSCALFVGAPFGVVLALGAVDALVSVAYRPAQARLLPTMARTPSELTALAARLSNVKGASQVIGALAGALAMDAAGANAAFVLATLTLALAAGGSLLVVRRLQAETYAPAAAGARRSEGAFRVASGVGRVMAVWGVRSFGRGLWLTMMTVVAIELIGVGESGVGLLMVASGIGVLAGFPASRLLVGHHSLLGPLAAALALSGAPLLLIAAVPQPVPALAAVSLWGLGTALADATLSSLLFRIVSGRDLASVVGVTESLKLGLAGAGALAVPVLVALLGIRGAIAFTAALPFALLALEWRGLRHVDEVAGRRVQRVELLARVPLLRELRVDALEHAAAALVPLGVPAGTELVRQDDPHARRLFILEDGIADVLVDGWLVSTLGPGSSFGEKALLRPVPRAATVRARTPLRLQTLDRQAFLAAATGAPDGTIPEPEPGEPRAPALTELLRSVPLLAGLDQPALDEITTLGRQVLVASGEDVVREGEPGDRFYVVLEGSAAVYAGERIVRTLAPADHFGEIALLHDTPRTATVRGLTDLRLFSLDRDALEKVQPSALTAAKLV
jgi:CRP-like cAMP-binding protein